MTNRTANPCTRVRSSARPPIQPVDKQRKNSGRNAKIGKQSPHDAYLERIATGPIPGTALQTSAVPVPEGFQVSAYVITPRRDHVALGEYTAPTLEEAEAMLLGDSGLETRWRRAIREWANSRAAHKRVRRAKWFAQRRRTDAQFRLNANMRSAVHQSLKGLKRGRSWLALVDYTLDDLRAHLAARFVDGMTWANYGQWHVDHVRPLSSFNITGPDCDDFKAAWALTNLQPLWGPENLRKGSKW